MWPERFSGEEDGRSKDFSTLVGECQPCHKEKGTEKHEVRREIPEAFRRWEQEAKTSKKEWKWQRSMVTHPLNESQWIGHFSMKK